MSVQPEDILGQLMIVRLAEPRWDVSFEGWLRARRPGGILLAERLPRTPGALADFLSRVDRALSPTPFLAMEEEGGTVDPLRAFFPPLPSPQAVAARGLSAAAQLGELIGQALRLLSFNTNLAPVLDLTTPFSQRSLGTRSFGSNPSHVARFGLAFVRGLERHKVLACGKHFPGLGSVPAASGGNLPQCSKPMVDLWREDLIPYRELLPRLPLVMVSLAAYKAFDFDLPRAAALSSQVVEGLLHIKLGYCGVAVAGFLGPQTGYCKLDPERAAVQALNAGCDMLVADERSMEAIGRALNKALHSGTLSPQRLEQALRRIREVKRKLLPPSARISPHKLDQLIRSIENFSKEFRPEEQRIG
jgi:beta-N-acetylhexosaminidase